jgi:hypothetical protein
MSGTVVLKEPEISISRSSVVSGKQEKRLSL